MKLIIMRHGQAEQISSPDAARVLTSLGEKQSVPAGKWFQHYLRANSVVDLALVSSYSRAEQTFLNLKRQVTVSNKQVCEDVVPNGNPQVAHDYIKVMSESNPQLNNLLIVSHMPFVSYFLEEVLFDSQSMLFDTSSLAIVDYSLASGAGKIDTVYHPDVSHLL